jgi:hypothetical protein
LAFTGIDRKKPFVELPDRSSNLLRNTKTVMYHCDIKLILFD